MPDVWTFTEVPKPTDFGDSRRQAERAKRDLGVERTAYAALPALHPGLARLEDNVHITLAEIENWLSRVEASMLKGRGLMVLRRFVRRGFIAGARQFGWEIELPARLIEVRDPQPVIDVHSIERARSFQQTIIEPLLQSLTDPQIMGRFPANLERVEANAVDRDLRRGQLICSAIAFGGLLDWRAVGAFVERFPENLHMTNEWLWVDIHIPIPGALADSDCRLRRWFPDPITEALLLRWVQQRLGVANAGRRFCEKRLQATVNRFLLRYSDRRPKVLPLQRIRECVVASYGLDIEPVLVEYARGALISESMSPETWWRYLSERPLRPQARLATLSPHKKQTVQPDRQQNPDAELLNTEDALSRLRALVKFAPRKEKVFPDGTVVPASELVSLLSEMGVQLSRFLDEYGTRLPPAVHALALWTEHMACEGTRRRKNPKPRTVNDYLMAIDRPLALAMENVDFSRLGERQLEACYREVIDRAAPGRAPFVNYCLFEFHRFMARRGGWPDVAWDEVAEGLGPGYWVDASLITPGEYMAALEMLRSDEDATERSRLLRSVALVLTYRLGLRVSELLELAVSDIHPDGTAVVRPSGYGTTKTQNGIRVIEGGERLSASEHGLLESWLLLRKNELGAYGDPQALLFGAPDDPFTPLADEAITGRIREALFLVTGDDKVRMKFLRHGFATRECLLGSGSEKLRRLAQEDKTLEQSCPAYDWQHSRLGVRGPTKRAVWRVSADLGHGEPSTSVFHYIHGLDLLLHDAVSRRLPTFPDDVLASLVGMTKNNLRVRRHRIPEQAALPALVRQARIRWIEEADVNVPGFLMDEPGPIGTLPEFNIWNRALETSGSGCTRADRVANALFRLYAGARSSEVQAAAWQSLVLVEKWAEADRQIQMVTTPRGVARFPESHWPRRKLTRLETNMIDKLTAMRGQGDPELARALTLYFRRKSARPKANFLDLTSKRELDVWVHFLLRIGLPESEVVCSCGSKVEKMVFGDDCVRWMAEHDIQTAVKPPAASAYRVRLFVNGKYSVRFHWVLRSAIIDMLAREELTFVQLSGF